MLLRLIAENIYSFKDAAEFNTFPSSKSHSHEQHKMACSHATALRLAAIYGANGAGKSNLLSAIKLLKEMVTTGSLNKVYLNGGLQFRFALAYESKSSGLAIEFCQNNKNFYYHIEFQGKKVMLEELLLSRKTKDDIIFRRENESIELPGNVNETFMDALDRLVRPDMLLLSFFGEYYPGENPLAAEAYRWFTEKLQIVLPGSIAGTLPHLMDSSEEFMAMVNKTIPELKTGISSLRVEKEVVTEDSVKGSDILFASFKEAQNNPGVPQVVRSGNGKDTLNLVYETGEVWKKSLVAVHSMADGRTYSAPVSIESDGTRRLIEYMPLFYAVTRAGGVYIVDEIERSVHPIMIKDIVRKISESESAVGQLIFTTHESGLLDQDIFRPDEIWFAQKDSEQATKLYPLSDYNIHRTANIENGYLAGRYGGIPFLSNLKDLHW
jgi:AAA15 family ATPase/GTPase